MENLQVINKVAENKAEEDTAKAMTEPAVMVLVDITNAGDQAGAEVVQCYVADPECSVERPVKELKAFSKVFLKPGETKRIELPLPYRAFTFYDVEKKDFVVEPGVFKIMVGNASDNCVLEGEVTL